MNYGELKSQFLELLNRSDCTDGLAITFLRQGFSRIQRELRIPAMEREVYVETEANLDSVLIPMDFLELRDAIAGETPLEKVSYRQLLTKSAVGSPRFFARRGGEFVFRPMVPPGLTLTLLYYGECGPLASDEDVNELTAIAPDLCLYSALAYAGDYFTHDKSAEWEGRYQQIRDEMNEQALSEEFTGGPMCIQSAYPIDD